MREEMKGPRAWRQTFALRLFIRTDTTHTKEAIWVKRRDFAHARAHTHHVRLLLHPVIFYRNTSLLRFLWYRIILTVCHIV